MGRSASDPLRAAKLGGIAAILVIGWLFVLWSNKFHVTAPVVFVCLGYLAVVMMVVNLWRTGAAASAVDAGADDWDRPIGARGELEKEKRTLLKAIKEAEFDLAMGKLSQHDADTLVRQYRGRAIEVIKELDRLGDTAELSRKELIEREVKARLELAAQDKPSKRAKNAVEARKKVGDARAAKVAAKSDSGPEAVSEPVSGPEPDSDPVSASEATPLTSSAAGDPR